MTYVLPSGPGLGYVGEAPEGAQSITLELERLVPEALFHPQDHGINSAGVAEMVLECIHAVPEPLWQPHLASLAICGGLARLPGLAARLRAELLASLPSHWAVELRMEEEPEISVWQGAAQHALRAELQWTKKPKEVRPEAPAPVEAPVEEVNEEVNEPPASRVVGPWGRGLAAHQSRRRRGSCARGASSLSRRCGPSSAQGNGVAPAERRKARP